MAANANRRKFEQCLRAGKYELVSPAETCTIETAKKLQIFDSKHYVQPQFQETQTFNKKYDRGRTMTAQLCRDEGNEEAFPFCQIEYGPAFTRKAGSRDQCVVLECPPDFDQGSDNRTCVKPKNPSVVNKADLCDERFYDWFTVPNYYLGNGIYKTKEGSKCHAPCPPQHVPFRKKDPVDMYRSTFTEEPDHLHQCIHKQYYMSGRYDNTPEFSPLAWIKRLTTGPKDLLDDWLAELKKQGVNPSEPYLAERIKPHADTMYNTLLKEQIPLTIEDLYRPGKHYLEAATFELENDKHGFREKALEICAHLKQDEPAFISEYRKQFPDLSDREFDLRLKLLKQACDHCFCKEEGHCFSVKPFLGQKEVAEVDEKSARSRGGAAVASADPATAIEDQVMPLFHRAIIVFLLIVFTPVLLYLGYMLLRKLFGKNDRLMQLYKEKVSELKSQRQQPIA